MVFSRNLSSYTPRCLFFTFENLPNSLMESSNCQDRNSGRCGSGQNHQQIPKLEVKTGILGWIPLRLNQRFGVTNRFAHRESMFELQIFHKKDLKRLYFLG